MILYLNRAEALSLVAAYRVAAKRITPTDAFFGSRAIARLKKLYTKDQAKLSVTDNSDQYYAHMRNRVLDDAIRNFDLAYIYRTYKALPKRVYKLPLAKEGEIDETPFL